MFKIEAKRLTKNFGPLVALDNVDFTLEQGRIIGLLGPNGSGKTTLLKLMNGLLSPTSGEILAGGAKPGIESKRRISYLPEQSYLNDWMKVRDIISFFTDFYEDFDTAKAKDMLAEMNIDENRKLKNLSKGTKEKVQLVLVMSRNAHFYLLDEPIGGVDPAARDYILETILTKYNPEASILISTHLIGDVEKIFDDVLFLNRGRIAIAGDAENIRMREGKSIDALFREVFKC